MKRLRFEKITKRTKFVASALFLATVFYFGNFFALDKFRLTLLLTAISFLATYWCLWADLSGIRYILLVILPTLFTAGFSFFSSFLAAGPLGNLVLVGLFAISFYAVTLTLNIYNVAAVRTIQLLRAAHAAGFFFTIVTALLVFNALWFFRLFFWQNFFLFWAASFLLSLQALWAIELKGRLEGKVFHSSWVASLVVGETAVALSFWPAVGVLSALFLAALLYTEIGILQLSLERRLNRRLILEYLGVGIFVFWLMFFKTSWGG